MWRDIGCLPWRRTYIHVIETLISTDWCKSRRHALDYRFVLPTRFARSGQAAELDRLESVRARPAHATDARCRTRRFGVDVDQHLGKRVTRARDESLCDLIGIAKADGFDFDDELLIERVMLEDAPAPVGRVEPALQRGHRHQAVLSPGNASRNAVIGARGTIPCTTRRQRAEHDRGGDRRRPRPRSESLIGPSDVIYLTRISKPAQRARHAPFRSLTNPSGQR